jgi:hypothetical protein
MAETNKQQPRLPQTGDTVYYRDGKGKAVKAEVKAVQGSQSPTLVLKTEAGEVRAPYAPLQTGGWGWPDELETEEAKELKATSESDSSNSRKA